ncbi:MAG: M1 family metallopeptidase [Bacteroidetes bacterium]|nr:M1 family metallopeptidase [Bacteroidota bacterium]
MRSALIWLVAVAPFFASAQGWQGKFEQLNELLPTPNGYRTGSGAPGPDYWQQRADYVMSCEVNDDNQSLTGSGTITYYNNAPEALSYLWLQLDQNINAPNSLTALSSPGAIRDSIPAKNLGSMVGALPFKGGYQIKAVKDAAGKPLPYLINYTMMRVELPKPLKTGEKFSFYIEWFYNINDRMLVGGRSGTEYFPEDGNYVYTIAQWFPRMCVFDDYEGWQNKQFLGGGEFALTFGDYKVRITVPSDHVVGATGWLQNPKEALSAQQLERFEASKNSFDKPLLIVTPDEAKQKEKERAKTKKTWEFHAENVRDFAFAHSRKFIWDAQAVRIGSKVVMAQSLYPKEGNPLWEMESTKAIKNTLEVYSARTIDYPYPAAYSVHAASIGMEYPMICFNFGRPPKDGTISKRLLERMVGVIVHEVGHNFFPMIINSDERQWTWMDEGLNTFLEKETKRERYPDFDLTSEIPKGQVAFMKGDKSVMRPIMAMADNQSRYNGPNGYTKPSAALTLLRETVMGPELFDQAFKTYAERWAFKHPKPGDFFRSMEDASAVDLDWFWRGWFYSTDHVDVTLDQVKWFRVKKTSVDPERKKIKTQVGDLKPFNSASGMTDFSDGPREFNLMNTPTADYREFMNRVNDNSLRTELESKNIYELTFKNTGGLISPVIIEWTYKDGSKEIEKIPAEVWRTNENEFKKVFVKAKEVVNIVIDPDEATADVNRNDNVFPKKSESAKFDQFKQKN